jgi:hypothetical protein
LSIRLQDTGNILNVSSDLYPRPRCLSDLTPALPFRQVYSKYSKSPTASLVFKPLSSYLQPCISVDSPSEQPQPDYHSSGPRIRSGLVQTIAYSRSPAVKPCCPRNYPKPTCRPCEPTKTVWRKTCITAANGATVYDGASECGMQSSCAVELTVSQRTDGHGHAAAVAVRRRQKRERLVHRDDEEPKMQRHRRRNGQYLRCPGRTKKRHPAHVHRQPSRHAADGRPV